MIDRVFDFAEAPCCGVFDHATEGSVRANVLKISRDKAVFDTGVRMRKGDVLEIVLEVPDKPAVTLQGRIIDSGGQGLFLRFEHADDKAGSRLQTMLVELSLRPRQALADFGVGNGASPNEEIRSSILSKAKTVRSTDLAARHADVHVLGMSAITGLIKSAVEEALENIDRQFDSKERDRLMQEAKEVFQKRLSSLQTEKQDVETRSKQFEEQLKRAQELLAQEQQRIVTADQFTVSDQGMVEIEKRLERILTRVIQTGGGSKDAEDEMRQVVARLLDDEREKISEKEQSAQSDALVLLEHKVDRLAKALQDTEKERDRAQRRAQILEANGGGNVANVLFAGLDEDDPDKDKKLDLLRELLDDNREVRDHMAAKTGGGASTPASPDNGNRRKQELSTPDPQPAVETSSFQVKKIEVKSVAPPPLER